MGICTLDSPRMNRVLEARFRLFSAECFFEEMLESGFDLVFQLFRQQRASGKRFLEECLGLGLHNRLQRFRKATFKGALNDLVDVDRHVLRPEPASWRPSSVYPHRRLRRDAAPGLDAADAVPWILRGRLLAHAFVALEEARNEQLLR